ncbi:WcbI family polysaccharide biosynthesis putative acetyltransferase [Mobilicoccus sp.]|uniref:WcbI family polysaccharide biosynthesis putative acetyltransferase n=1 Tax=Mobilicoccus sp. TaxID=2034349 RepID=UPI0028AEFEC3|nr:WcbI family polysaccharide biosynthesis putative acetyltransferase [Mobilicoccus sp.]
MTVEHVPDETPRSSPPDHPASGFAEASGRRRHYDVFYGLAPLPEDDGRPCAIVLGNCQAESVRVLLGDGPAASVRTVRVPPVFEMGAEDLPHLTRLLGHVDILVAQPVREGYRGLPLGTAQVSRLLSERARVVRIPPLRYAGLYPRHVIVRSGPAGEAGDPPLAPYHDLATASMAAGRGAIDRVARDGVRTIAEESIAELERREREHDTVLASDLLLPAGVEAAHTLNHPGNPVLVGMVRRVQARLGLPADAADPGRTLLRSIYAPVLPETCRALGLPAGAAREGWSIDGGPVSDEAVREAHLGWYAEHPGLAAHVLEVRARTVALLHG